MSRAARLVASSLRLRHARRPLPPAGTSRVAVAGGHRPNGKGSVEESACAEPRAVFEHSARRRADGRSPRPCDPGMPPRASTHASTPHSRPLALTGLGACPHAAQCSASAGAPSEHTFRFATAPHCDEWAANLCAAAAQASETPESGTGGGGGGGGATASTGSAGGGLGVVPRSPISKRGSAPTAAPAVARSPWRVPTPSRLARRLSERRASFARGSGRNINMGTRASSEAPLQPHLLAAPPDAAVS